MTLLEKLRRLTSNKFPFFKEDTKIFDQGDHLGSLNVKLYTIWNYSELQDNTASI